MNPVPKTFKGPFPLDANDGFGCRRLQKHGRAFRKLSAASVPKFDKPRDVHSKAKQQLRAAHLRSVNMLPQSSIRFGLHFPHRTSDFAALAVVPLFSLGSNRL